jgi:two-component system cell cycle sensor histidine kinase/response regulator CckA
VGDADAALRSNEPELALGAGQHVLVVDDEPVVLSACQQLLMRLNYEVTACESSERALELLRRQPAAYDVLITDQAMPDLTGPDLAAEARRLRPDLPIVLATGFLDDIARTAVATLGIDSVLSKPYTLRDLSTALRTVLETRAHH